MIKMTIDIEIEKHNIEKDKFNFERNYEFKKQLSDQKRVK